MESKNDDLSFLEHVVENKKPKLEIASLEHQNPNPLLIREIIAQVLVYIPSKQLPKVSGVCSSWNAECERLIEKRIVLTLKCANHLVKNDLAKFLDDFPVPKDVGADSDSDQLTFNLLWTKCELKEVQVSVGNLALSEFLLAHGSRIKQLTLRESSKMSLGQLCWALEFLPSLKSLSILRVPEAQTSFDLVDVGSDSDTEAGGGCFPELEQLTILTAGNVLNHQLSDYQMALGMGAMARPLESQQRFGALLSLFPSLQALNIQDEIDNNSSLHWHNYSSRSSRRGKYAFAQQISRYVIGGLMLAQYELRNLSRLKFPLLLNYDLVLRFNEFVGLHQLKELDIMFDENMEETTTREFLLRVGPGLRIAQFGFPLPPLKDFNGSVSQLWNQLCGEIELGNLVELTLENYRSDIKFLASMTNLTSLAFVNGNPEIIKTSLRWGPKASLRSLKFLLNKDGGDPAEFDFEAYNARVLKWTKIAMKFPQLNILQLHGATDECLQLIFEHLPRLTSLTCTGSFFSDKGIVGLDELTYQEMVKESLSHGTPNMHRVHSQLNIGNLENLRRLQLESDDLGLISIVYGIIECTGLTHLSLKSILINDMALVEIRNLKYLKELNVVGCPAITEDAIIRTKLRSSSFHVLSAYDDE